MAHENATQSEREIQDDVVNVSVLAWLGGVTTILIIISVLLLTGIFYQTSADLDDQRQADAEARVTDFEAQRTIDQMVVDGYYQHPDTDDGQGNVTRGTVNVPVATGMRQVVEAARR